MEILLEACEDVANLLGSAEVGNGIGNGVVIFEQERGAQFRPIQFFDANLHVMGQCESQKDPLLTVEVARDFRPWPSRPVPLPPAGRGRG